MGLYAWGVPNGWEMNMTQTNDAIDATELLDTLKITKIEPRPANVGGAWVTGTMGGHRFDALVFADHATESEYELGESRISKISVQPIGDHRMVACFDRGWDLRPTTPVAEQIVDLLAAGLAETVYAE